jgi:hypothetical protein
MELRIYVVCLIAYFIFSLATVSIGLSQPIKISFEHSAWDFSHAAESRVAHYKGRKSLYLEGKAFFKTNNISDGVVEVDVTTPVPRAFAGILFRTQSSTEYEEMYIRLHKSGSPDAIQYTPVFNDIAAWQLYGPGDGWGMAAFDRNEWIPLRIKFTGNQVSIFAGQSNDAILETNLRRDEDYGGLGLWALFGAYFSNLRFTPQEKLKKTLNEPDPEHGVITNWNISNAFLANDVNLAEAPIKKHVNWSEIKSEPNGLVNLSRYLPEEGFRNQPNDGESNISQSAIGTYAKASITSESDQVKKLYFGYSDNIVILLNGKPIFSGESGFRARDPLFQGMIGYHDAVFLDLKEGKNELIFAVTETFGGWGLMAKFENITGISF